MSYSACDFVDSIATIVHVSEDETRSAACELGFDPDNLSDDDAHFAGWAEAVCNKISAALPPANESDTATATGLAEYIESARQQRSAEVDAELIRVESLPANDPEFAGIWTKPRTLAQMRQRYADRSADSLLDVRSYENEWRRANS